MSRIGGRRARSADDRENSLVFQPRTTLSFSAGRASRNLRASTESIREISWQDDRAAYRLVWEWLSCSRGILIVVMQPVYTQ